MHHRALPILIMWCAWVTPFHSVLSQLPQALNPDSIIQHYQAVFETKLDFINGRAYKPYHHPTHDNPYLHKTAGTGQLFINGRCFKNNKLLYDVYKDLLIVSPKHVVFADPYIQLNKADIDSFTITFETHPYSFINLKTPGLIKHLEPGFYQPIYRGPAFDLLIKHSAHAGLKNARVTYKPIKQTWLIINKQALDISTKKKLRTVYPKKKQIIRQHLQTNDIRYKKLNSSQLIELIKVLHPHKPSS